MKQNLWLTPIPTLLLIMTGGLSLLNSCTPANSAGVSGPPTTFTATDTQAICAAQPRIVNQGSLAWGPEGDEISLPAPYKVTCPTMIFSNPDGMNVTVQAPSVTEAIKLFAPDAFFLSYYADYFVRLPEPGVITLDSPDDLLENQLNEAKTVTVTITPAGAGSQALWQAGVASVVRLDPAQAFTINIKAPRSPNPWPQVYIDPAQGLIRARLGN